MKGLFAGEDEQRATGGGAYGRAAVGGGGITSFVILRGLGSAGATCKESATGSEELSGWPTRHNGFKVDGQSF